jgi:hypothetical protein
VTMVRMPAVGVFMVNPLATAAASTGTHPSMQLLPYL